MTASRALGRQQDGSGDRRVIARRSFVGASIIFMLALVVAAPWITYKPAPFTGEGNPLRQYSYFLVFGMVIYGCQLRDYPARALALPVNVGLVLGYCWFSLLWSDAPGIAIRRLTLTTIIAWSIFAAVRQVGFDQTLKHMRQVSFYVLIINFLTVILFPAVGLHGIDGIGADDLAGDWRGVLIQKNFAGAFCAFTVMVYLFCNHGMRPLLRWGVVFGALFFLIMTNSKTSLGLLVLSVVCGLAFMRYDPRFRIIAVPLVLILSGIVALLAVANWDIVMTPFQGEDALTGRVQIWPVLIAYWRDHWWLGAGYGSFWNVGVSGPIFSYARASSWVVDLGNGHNGYLDLLITIGVPGLVLTVLAVIIWPLFKLFSEINLDGERRGFILCMLLFCALHNFTETSLFERDTIVNVFLMFTIACLHVAGGKETRPGADSALSRWRN